MYELILPIAIALVTVWYARKFWVRKYRDEVKAEINRLKTAVGNEAEDLADAIKDKLNKIG